MSERFDIARVAAIEARFDDAPWPWAVENAAAIAALWARESAAKPAMFDGVVLIALEAAVGGDALRLRYAPVRFSAFLAFKRMGYPDPVAVNAFGMAALRDGEGRFLLGEMGAHTANAGALYFPGGTPDLSDVTPDGRVDLAGSVLRELAEETTYAPEPDRIADVWHVVRRGGVMALMRPIDLPESAPRAARAFSDALAREAQPELSGFHVVADAAALDDPRIPPFMRAYLGWRMGRRVPDPAQG